MKSLTLEDFAALFGVTVSEIPAECRALIQRHNFNYRPLNAEEREKTLSEVLKKIDSGTLTLAGKEGKARWEKGWGENLEKFEKEKDLSALTPKYIRPHQPVRLNQEYVFPEDPEFEKNWYAVFRKWLFKRYFPDVDAIYEFGCGSGFNLAELAELFPGKKLYGLDWAAASRDTVDRMASLYGWPMKGFLFDFFSPDQNLKLEKNSAVLTIGALEQTGDNYQDFLDYLLRESPAICVHVEPICEWYDQKSPVDEAAIRFHQVRRYWRGFPEKLKALEAEGKVEILKMKRSYFGSLFIEGYSQIIWRPKGKVS